MSASDTPLPGSEGAPQGDSGTARVKRTLRKQTFFERWRRMSLPNHLMFLATLVIAVATVVNVIVFTLESISGSSQTDKLVTYAKTQANSAGDQADAAQQFSDTSEDINSRMQDAVDQLQVAADNAKASIKATQNALRLEQRPWVFISAMDLKPLVLNDPLIAEYAMKNEGKTPATLSKESKIFMTISFRPIDHLKDPPGNPPFKAGVAFPEMVYGPALVSSASMVGDPAHTLGPAEIAAYNAKPPTLWVYLYGRINYVDAFGTRHTTSFCSVSNGTNTLEGCIDGVYPTYAN
jgi:hypothetical protein